MLHYFARFAKDVPIVYTIHDPLPQENTLSYKLFSKFPDHNYISISDAQRNSKLKLQFIATVYHGIHAAKYPFQTDPSDYFLFMGRLIPEKGLHSCIAVSEALNIRLEIATQMPDKNTTNNYFNDQIKPHLNSALIGEPGIVSDDNKHVLYKQARALFFPIEWEEPFGMVMIEAMACGTPVIAYNRGSVPEIVRDGVTGFIVEPEEGQQNNPTRPPLNLRGGEGGVIKKRGIPGLIEAVQRIGEIDRSACRKHVAENFSVEKMVEGYERVYQKVIEERVKREA
jgi:glycosyltransferase involved in cell wall biosynthesis